jgi:hypothetical protein
MMNQEPINKKAILLFHQGWTDIINCLALLSYYSKIYTDLTLIIRSEAAPLVNSYLKDSIIKVNFYNKEDIDLNSKSIIESYEGYDKLFHGEWDIYRDDDYRGRYQASENFFVEKFYIEYDIPYSTRVDSFTFVRDLEREETVYNKFVNNHGAVYVLSHEDQKRGLKLHDFESEWPVINLDGRSDSFFEYIKILQNAKEIHMIDSVWAAFVYQLDTKLRIFHDISINVHCIRGYQAMFKSPKRLDNWRFIQSRI